MWIPSQGSAETIRWPAHPDRKYVYLNVYSSLAAVEQFMGMYRRIAADEHDHTIAPEQLGLALSIYAAETDEIARKEAKPHIEAFSDKFLRVTNETLMPPGYTSISSLKAIGIAQRELLMGGHTMDRVDELDMFIVGSAATVCERLEEFQQRLGFGQLCAILQFGTQPHEQTKRISSYSLTK